MARKHCSSEHGYTTSNKQRQNQEEACLIDSPKPDCQCTVEAKHNLQTDHPIDAKQMRQPLRKFRGTDRFLPG